MRYKYLAYAIMLLVILTFSITACSEKTTESEANDLGPANVLARQGMEQLNQVIIDLGENEPDINGSDDIMLETTFNQIKSKFDQALEKDLDNPMANLGLAILDIVRVNYDDELWSMIHAADSLDTGSKRIINNQFQFLAATPLRLMRQMNMQKSQALSIMRMQNYIKTSVLPKLDNAATHLGNAIALADSNAIQIDTGEEMVEVDCGEIYAFRASVYAITAAFNLMVAYNWDMVDSNNSYEWITAISNVHVSSANNGSVYHYNVDNGTLTLDYWIDWYQDNSEEQQRDEIMAKTLQYNLNHNPAFGTIANQTYLTNARANILKATSDVRHCTDYILHETDSQENDIIKTENIVDMNNDIPPTDEEAPNFTHSWNTIDDVTNWLDTVVNGSYEMTENNVTFTLNMGAFFNGAVSDIRNMIPYFHWKNANESWIENQIDYQFGFDTNSYSFYYYGDLMVIANISHVQKVYHRLRMENGYFTTPSGAEIGDEMPYFPDYTFNGILPGMTREKMILLFD